METAGGKFPGGWNIRKVILKGKNGSISLGNKDGLKGFYCVKSLEKRFIKSQILGKHIEREVDILSKMKHPNIIKFIEKQEDDVYCYLCYNFCNGGNLKEALQKKKKLGAKFSEEEVQHLMKQICSAINHLHSNNILHRKIRLEHIMLNFPSKADKDEMNIMKATAVLINFSFARPNDGGMMSALGPVDNYKDPGVFLKNMRNYMENGKSRSTVPYDYDEKIDIWSLGILCCELFTGAAAFDAGSSADILSKAEKGDYFLPSSLHQETVSFIMGMLQLNPEKRAKASQLMSHPFLTQGVGSFHNLDYSKFKVIGDQISITNNMLV